MQRDAARCNGSTKALVFTLNEGAARCRREKFFGALHGQRATKGIFISTSKFSREAVEYAEDVTPRVILIDGEELAQLMIEYGVGVTASREYALKRLDLDYFVTDELEAPTAPIADPANAVEAAREADKEPLG